MIDQVLSVMQVSSHDIEPMQKLCVLSFDEMKIKKQYVYDKKNDETTKPANYAQVAMIRGLVGRWKQVIFYDYDCKMTKEKVNSIIAKVNK